jgi:hypothetical protein
LTLNKIKPNPSSFKILWEKKKNRARAHKKISPCLYDKNEEREREREREPTGLDKATTFGFSNQKPLDN